MRRRFAARFLGLLGAVTCAASCRPPDEPVARWDLLALVQADAARPAGRVVRTHKEYGEMRHVVAVRVPDRMAYSVVLPPNAVLDFGFAVEVTRIRAPEPERAEPVRIRAFLTGARGDEQVLLEQRVNVRDDPDDRRWFDVRLGLEARAGETVTLALEATTPDAHAKGETIVLFSAPRVLVPAPADVNLLFITIDCLRADHLGAWGYGRPTSPWLDGLAADGVRFARAYTAAPMTMPSMPQFFTGRVFPIESDETFIGPIARAGIPTAGIVNNAWLSLWFTLFRRGPAHDHLDLLVAAPSLTAHDITNRAIAWLEHQSENRFALVLHYLDAHSPYGMTPPRFNVFGDPGYAGPVGREFNDAAGARAGRYDAADQARVVSLYDASISSVDEQVGRLLTHLARTALLDKTVIVVSADHGEELWDHGGFFHGQSLFDELLHVPLIVRLPGGAHAGTVVERQVRSVDVAPSLLAWMKVPAPPELTGNPLAAAIAAPHDPGDDLVATATNPEHPARYALRTPTHKLVEDTASGVRRLYDLVRDPGETRDVLGAEPPIAGALGERLDAARAPLRARGWQVRVVGPASGAPFRLVLDSLTEGGGFAGLDRVHAGPEVTLDLSKDGRRLVIAGRADASARGVRFDRRPLYRGRDALALTLEVDGTAVPESAVRIGASGVLPPGGRLDADASDSIASASTTCERPPAGVRACVWRVADFR